MKMSFKVLSINLFSWLIIFAFLSSWTFLLRLIFADCRTGIHVYKNNVLYVYMDIFAAICIREIISFAKIAKIN